jgi:hypothetical protein
MPCLDESLTLGGNEAANLGQLSSGETMIGCEVNRVEPELACLLVPFDMHMHRLIAIEAVKVKPIRTQSVLDRGHDSSSVSHFRKS